MTGMMSTLLPIDTYVRNSIYKDIIIYILSFWLILPSINSLKFDKDGSKIYDTEHEMHKSHRKYIFQQ